MKPKISIKGSKIRIAAFECGSLGRVGQKTIDLSPYAGERVRIWLDKDGSYSLDPRREHFWQIAELQMPEQKYREIETREDDTGTADTGGASIKTEPVPLDLSGAELQLWELP